jgi:hypothetical protein
MSERVRITRPVIGEAAEKLDIVSELKKSFPQRGIYDRTHKAQTLVTKGEFKTLRPTSTGLRYVRSLDRILYPLPKSGEQEHTFDVSNVKYYSSSIGHRSLALTLDDPEGILQHERDVYLRRMNKRETPLAPHVTIVDIDASHATSDILKWVEGNAPASLTLGPIAFDPNIDPIIRPTSTSIKSRSKAFPLPPMRTIDQIRIPDVLFNSYRVQTASESQPHE